MKKISEEIWNSILAITKDITEIVFLYIAKITDVLKAHQADFSKLATTLTEVGQDVGRTIAKALTQMKKEIESFVAAVIEQLKALPITEVIKEKYAEFTGGMNVPDHIIELLNEFVNTLKGVLPNPELQEVVQVTFEYLVKKLRSEKVDDAAAFKQIYEALQKAVKTILKMLQAEGTTEQLQNLISNNVSIGVRVSKSTS